LTERLEEDKAPEFGDYTKERWDFTQQHARRLITASKTVKKIESEPNGSVLPTSESQARVLAKVDDPVALWKKAQDETGKDQPTANEIAQKMEDGIEVDENLTKDKDSHTVLVPSKNKERTVISINKEMAERKAQMNQLENEAAELEKLIPIGAILERDPTQCYIRNRVINVYESIEDAANSIGVDVQELYEVIYGGRAAEVCGSIWWVQEQEDCN